MFCHAGVYAVGIADLAIPSEIHTSIQTRLDADYNEIAGRAVQAEEAGADELIVYILPPHDVRVLEPLAASLSDV